MFADGRDESAEYQLLQQALEAVGHEQGAAEVHGTLTGVLTAASGSQAESGWVSLVLGNLADPSALEARQLSETLLQVHARTREALSSDNFSLQLFLPGEEADMEARVRGLGTWCQGFLLGFSSTADPALSLSSESREFVEDLTRISEVEYDEDDPEEAEQHLMELEEYVRVGVLALFEELHAESEGKTQPGSGKASDRTTFH